MPEKLHSPAADRNKAPLLEVLIRVLPPTGTVLEIASGSGQHVVWFAAAMKGLRFQPSDPDASARASIAAHLEDAGVPIAPPLDLDVLRPWPIGAVDAILAVNMVHISPWEATLALLAGASERLPLGGPLVLYGPYRIGGAHTAESNAAFDESLRARDPRWGVRDLEAVVDAARAVGLRQDERVPMPANNQTVIFRKI